jgi:hypothetical protein
MSSSKDISLDDTHLVTFYEDDIAFFPSKIITYILCSIHGPELV